jgi:hypothetical protein
LKPTLILGLVFCSCAKDGASDSGTPNTLPSLEESRIAPDPLYAGNAVNCEAFGWFDADGDPGLFDLEWFLNGEPVSKNSLSEGDWFRKGDEVGCVLTPLDSFGAGESAEAILVVSNSLPTGDSAEILPAESSVHSTLSVQVSGETDADKDAVTWNTHWTVNEIFLQEGSLLSGNLLERGDEVFAVVRANDGEEDGDSITTPTLIIGNALPTVVSLSIYPSPATEKDLLSAIVEAHDDDGDSVSATYSWTVNGLDIWHGATLSNTYFKAGDSVQVSIVPFDGINTGEAVVSDPLVIE